MGLDMYLTKKTYIGANYEHRNVKGQINLTQGKDDTPIDIKLNRLSEIVEQVGYWRKANQIHRWFVENVQDGVDNCGDYPVTKEQLRKLLQLCRKVKESSKLVDGAVANGYRFEGEVKVPIIEAGKEIPNPEVAEKLLPTASGFFFGGTDYDENYMSDIDETIEILESLPLDGEDNYEEEFYYHSSW